MAAPSAYTTDWPAQITTTGEANGLLLQVPPATPFGAPAVLTLMLSGTYTTGVVLVRGKLKGSGSSGVYAPISGVNVLNNAAVGTGGSFTLVNSSTNLWRFGIGAYEEIEIYASSLATGAIDVMQTVGAPDLISPPVVNATVAAVDTTTGTFSSNVTIGGTLGVTGLTTLTGGSIVPDAATMAIGTGADILLSWDGTRFSFTQAATNSEMRYGVDGAGIDQMWYGDTASTFMTWDQSADSLIFADNAKCVFGSGSDIAITWNATNLIVSQAAANSQIQLGASGAGIDVVFYGDTAGANMTWDQSADALVFGAAANITFDATTGSKIGTATTQKIGFFNATPVVQPAANTDTTTGAAGGTNTVYLNTTYTGAGGTAAYTVGGVVTALKALGLLAP